MVAYAQCDSQRATYGKGVSQQPDIQQDNGNEFRDDIGNSNQALADSECFKRGDAYRY